MYIFTIFSFKTIWCSSDCNQIIEVEDFLVFYMICYLTIYSIEKIKSKKTNVTTS